jgi:hypothetical protein
MVDMRVLVTLWIGPNLHQPGDELRVSESDARRIAASASPSPIEIL